MSTDTAQLLAEIPLFSTLDATILIISCIEDGPAGPAHLLYQRGCQLVNDLKDYFEISPAQAQTGIPRSSFEAAYTRLKSAGYCLADPEAAWASFIELRSAYAEALHSLIKYWVVSFLLSIETILDSARGTSQFDKVLGCIPEKVLKVLP